MTYNLLNTLLNVEAAIDHVGATLIAARTHGTYLNTYKGEAIETSLSAANAALYQLRELIAEIKAEAEALNPLADTIVAAMTGQPLSYFEEVDA